METIALTVKDAAKAIGISKATLYREIRAGRGPKTTQVAGCRVVAVEELQKWFESCPTAFESAAEVQAEEAVAAM